MPNKPSTREKILDAVFELVYIHGYNGTSMSMILEACQIPKGSLYHHFKSKKEMVLAVIQERIAPRMDEFYQLDKIDNEHEINTLINSILKVSNKNELVSYGCPLNRLNQEMSPVDKEFEKSINAIYEKMRNKITSLLKNSHLKENVDHESLAEFVIATVWGNLSLSPKQSSKERYLHAINHLIAYLKSLK